MTSVSYLVGTTFLRSYHQVQYSAIDRFAKRTALSIAQDLLTRSHFFSQNHQMLQRMRAQTIFILSFQY